MKSPLKPLHNTISSSIIRDKIGQKKIIDSFFFFDGNYECMLAANNNFVIGHTSAYVVEEFWSSLREERQWVEGVCGDVHKVLNEPIYELLQETWHKEDTLFIRSALFFLLSRCSEKGLPSSGIFNVDGFNTLALKYLKQLSLDNMHFIHHTPEKPMDMIVPSRPQSIVLVNAGRYDYGLTQGTANHGIEEAPINHKKLAQKLLSLENRWLVNYQFSAPLLSLYRDATIILVDEYGNTTLDPSTAREVVIANF